MGEHVETIGRLPLHVGVGESFDGQAVGCEQKQDAACWVGDASEMSGEFGAWLKVVFAVGAEAQGGAAAGNEKPVVRRKDKWTAEWGIGLAGCDGGYRLLFQLDGNRIAFDF